MKADELFFCKLCGSRPAYYTQGGELMAHCCNVDCPANEQPYVPAEQWNARDYLMPTVPPAIPDPAKLQDEIDWLMLELADADKRTKRMRRKRDTLRDKALIMRTQLGNTEWEVKQERTRAEAAEARIARLVLAGDRMAHSDIFEDYCAAMDAWQQAKDAPA